MLVYWCSYGARRKTVSSLRTGHSRCIGGVEYDGCRVSHHWHGRRVGIRVVDGVPVSRTYSDARALALWLAGLPESCAPRRSASPGQNCNPCRLYAAERGARPLILAVGGVSHRMPQWSNRRVL